MFVNVVKISRRDDSNSLRLDQSAVLYPLIGGTSTNPVGRRVVSGSRTSLKSSNLLEGAGPRCVKAGNKPKNGATMV